MTVQEHRVATKYVTGGWRVRCRCGWITSGFATAALADRGGMRHVRASPTARVDPDEQRRLADAAAGVFDCHGYKTRTALRWAATLVEVSWRRGLPRVKFIHGGFMSSPDVAHERGSIRWSLYEQLDSGAWSRFAAPASDLHNKAAAFLVVALAANPRPEPDLILPTPPAPEYAVDRRD